MSILHSVRVLAGVSALVGSVTWLEATAGCPCQRGGTVSTAAPVPDWEAAHGLNAFPLPSAPVAGFPAGEFSPQGVSFPQGVIAGTDVPSTGVPGVGPGYSSATATTWQPPPGSLGRTYQVKSRPIPVEMHPRAAILDVHVKNSKSVRVHDMNVSRTEDYLKGFQDHQDRSMWHFTADPLIPGIPHIYRVEAHFDGLDGKDRIEERYVRLIMGRVVEIEI